VVLFDEIEKAHPEIWNTLLQVLEDGRLTDGQGRVVDFRNTIIIMTSNLGTEFARRGGALGFIQSGDAEAIADHQKIEKAMRETFRPEFLNRIDEVIIFEPLSREDVELMVDMQIRLVAQRLREAANITIHLTEPARYWLARKGYDVQFGARPLRRTIQRFVENPLSTRLLSGQFQRGDLIVIDEVAEELVFERQRDAASDFIEVTAPTPPAPQPTYEVAYVEPEGNAQDYAEYDAAEANDYQDDNAYYGGEYYPDAPQQG
jgi:ATP-dependent Clp protease ATP-binding subunit ClpC